jgi:hypothetical protein
VRKLRFPFDPPGGGGPKLSLAFTPSGRSLFCSSEQPAHATFWDVATGESLPPLGPLEARLTAAASSHDERCVVTVDEEGTLTLWERATGQPRFLCKDVGPTNLAACSPCGRYVALANMRLEMSWSGGRNTTPGFDIREEVRLVDVRSGKVVQRFKGHRGAITSLRFSPDGRILASGGADTTVVLWKVPDPAPVAPGEKPLTPEASRQLWTGLGGDADTAWRHMGTLGAAPHAAVRLLGEHLRPVEAVDPLRLEPLVRKLDSDDFVERTEATKQLKAFGEAGVPGLRKALAGQPNLEVRGRLEEILDAVSGSKLTPERLHALRGVELLERIGDDDARDLLRRLAAGAPGAWLTQESRTALRRLERRGPQGSVPNRP